MRLRFKGHRNGGREQARHRLRRARDAEDADSILESWNELGDVSLTWVAVGPRRRVALEVRGLDIAQVTQFKL